MVEILNQQKRYRINKGKFRSLLERLAGIYKLEDPEITLAFVENRDIRRLNREFLEKDAATDVLSFPMGERAADGKYYLGDIIISPDKAMKQCLKKEHGLERELEILAIHGFLHLLGFEHEKGLEEEDEKMREFLLEGYHGY